MQLIGCKFKHNFLFAQFFLEKIFLKSEFEARRECLI